MSKKLEHLFAKEDVIHADADDGRFVLHVLHIK